MTGRQGHRSMEMNGRSVVSYLVRTPRVPFSVLFCNRPASNGALSFQGGRGTASVVQWNFRPGVFSVV